MSPHKQAKVPNNFSNLESGLQIPGDAQWGREGGRTWGQRGPMQAGCAHGSLSSSQIPYLCSQMTA